jgi:hypothetical protein
MSDFAGVRLGGCGKDRAVSRDAIVTAQPTYRVRQGGPYGSEDRDQECRVGGVGEYAEPTGATTSVATDP